jgi:probable DNA repair protein
VVLSYPASENDRKLAPTPLVRDEWQTLKHASQDGWIARMRAAATLDELADEQAPAAPESSQPGGTSLFKDMAACYFRAFAQHRLHAKPLDEATLGLSYKDRGNAVHQALHRIWREIGSQARLAELSVAELSGLVARCVAEVVDRLPSGIGQRLEQRRLERLLGLWLEIEKSRDPFTVIASEESRSVNIAGFEITTRADRIDEVAPGREVILDYKTGNIKAGVWDGERPDEPQLPLYCATSGRPVAGAAFAVIRADELAFRGLTGGGVFLPDMKRMRIENEVAFSEQVARWRNVLVKLGEDFRDGDAGINPKHGACDHCRRWALCRIREFENAG